MTSGPRTLRAAGAAVAIGAMATAFLFLSIPRTSAVAVGDFAAIDAHVKVSMDASAVPGLAFALLVLALCGLAIGAAKVIAVAATRQARRLAAAA